MQTVKIHLEQPRTLARRAFAFVGIFAFILVFTPALVESSPQYPGTFIKTNHSRHATPMYPDGQHRNGAHRERHSATQVHTTTGLLHGIRRNVMGKEIHIYLGVPFAKPPLGPLRFKKPIPLEPWNGTYYAVNQPNTCYQETFESFPGFGGEQIWIPNTNISEDCLYLNMWVPKTRKTNMPILIWIYGGGYMSGTATLDIYNGEILAAETSTIVIGIQYRVGSFGFLFWNNEDAPGNVGLWDQVMAMKWVKENAVKFGGDPESITLFGESAGGGSVSFHLLSPYSREYISRGIIESGTLNTPWSIMDARTAKAIAKKLADDCNCTEGSDADILQCLRDLPAATVSALQWESYAPIMQFPSAPTIDGKFLPKHPLDMLKEGDFKKAPLLMGSNLNEGTYFILYDYIKYFDKDGDNCLPRETFLQIIEEVFGNLTTVQKDAIRFQYTHWESPSDPCKVTEKFADLVGDYYFICPSNKFAEMYAAHNAPVYYYFFTQRTSINPWGQWMGVMHADEIEYVFGKPLNGSSHTRAEKELSKRIMKYFATFAETGILLLFALPINLHKHLSTVTTSTFTAIGFGIPFFSVLPAITCATYFYSQPVSNSVVVTTSSPNQLWRPVDENSNEDWPLYTKAQPNYFILHSEKRGTGKGPRAHTCAFWNEFMPVIKTGTSPLPGSCEKERWGPNTSAAASVHHTRASTISYQNSMLLLVLASSLIALVKDVDILEIFKASLKDAKGKHARNLKRENNVFSTTSKDNDCDSENISCTRNSLQRHQHSHFFSVLHNHEMGIESDTLTSCLQKRQGPHNFLTSPLSTSIDASSATDDFMTQVKLSN